MTERPARRCLAEMQARSVESLKYQLAISLISGGIDPDEQEEFS